MVHRCLVGVPMPHAAVLVQVLVDLIRGLAKAGKTLITSTHELDIVRTSPIAWSCSARTGACSPTGRRPRSSRTPTCS
ncbi:MAG: hypothetical protein Q7S25_04545, partial [Candidatus Limnocylindria bacterium]|nr:hypothetical protein [Candidatus Limnocylindria bacterium]